MLKQTVQQCAARLQRGLVATLVTVGLAAGMVGCGGDSGSGSPTAAPSGTSTQRPDTAAALVKFNACLRANGVKVSDSGPSVQERGDAKEDPNFAAAAAKCKHHLAGTSIEVATGEDGGHVSEDQLKSLLAYARCMRSHGINMPDPDPDNGVVAPKGSSDFDQESEQFKSAHAACRSHLSNAEVTEEGTS